MQRREMTFVVEAPLHKVWRLLHPKPPVGVTLPRTIEYSGGRMQILVEGDEAGQGLVRICDFEVPKYLLTGGRARSWEVVVEARVDEISRYQAIGRPMFSHAEGFHTLRELPDGRTELRFVETYEVENRWLRPLLERRVHDFISKDNGDLYEQLLGHLGPVERTSEDGATAPPSRPEAADEEWRLAPVHRPEWDLLGLSIRRRGRTAGVPRRPARGGARGS